MVFGMPCLRVKVEFMRGVGPNIRIASTSNGFEKFIVMYEMVQEIVRRLHIQKKGWHSINKIGGIR